MSIYRMPKGKDVNEDLDFYIDLTKELAGRNPGPADDTIQNVAWTVPPALTMTDHSHTASVAYIKLSGGVLGTSYTLDAVITTAFPRIYERHFILKINLK